MPDTNPSVFIPNLLYTQESFSLVASRPFVHYEIIICRLSFRCSSSAPLTPMTRSSFFAPAPLPSTTLLLSMFQTTDLLLLHTRLLVCRNGSSRLYSVHTRSTHLYTYYVSRYKEIFILSSHIPFSPTESPPTGFHNHHYLVPCFQHRCCRRVGCLLSHCSFCTFGRYILTSTLTHRYRVPWYFIGVEW